MTELSSCDGMRVKVTLQELKGISVTTRDVSRPVSRPDVLPLCQGQDLVPRIPGITAAVAFAGSAEDMQVGSNFVCCKTGNVLVQSERARFDACNEGVYALIAEWSEGEIAVSKSGSSVSTQSVSKPHLTIRLPSRDPTLPSVPLSKMNRGCNVVHNEQTPSLSETEASDSDLEEQTSSFERVSGVRGESIFWSASNAGMPEIVELSISLIMDADDLASERSGSDSGSRWMPQEACVVGIAHLCFLGSDHGTTIMDLPVKKHSLQRSTTEESDLVVSVQDNASLRIRVDILPLDQEHVDSPQDLYSKSLLGDLQDIDPIMEQIQLAQLNHQTLRRKSAELRANEQARPDFCQKSQGMMCLSEFSLFELLNSVTDAVKTCDERALRLYRVDSMDSTIATADSLDI